MTIHASGFVPFHFRERLTFLFPFLFDENIRVSPSLYNGTVETLLARTYWLSHHSVPDLGTQSQCSRQLESKCGPCGPCYESTSLSIRAITSSSSPSRDIGNMLPFGYSRRTDSLLATCSLNWFAIGNFIGNKQLGKNFKYLCVIIRFPTPRARTHIIYKTFTTRGSGRRAGSLQGLGGCAIVSDCLSNWE